MPFQDVGTFNSIFKKTPLLGFNSSDEVEIGGIGSNNQRIIKVSGKLIHLDLSQKIDERAPRVKVQKVKKLSQVERTNKRIPELYRLLKPTEFMIYSAIKEVEFIDGIESLSKEISINSKTIAINLKKLVKLGLVKKTLLSSSSGIFYRLSVDTISNF